MNWFGAAAKDLIGWHPNRNHAFYVATDHTNNGPDWRASDPLMIYEIAAAIIPVLIGKHD
jgi:hypothetical protein